MNEQDAALVVRLQELRIWLLSQGNLKSADAVETAARRLQEQDAAKTKPHPIYEAIALLEPAKDAPAGAQAVAQQKEFGHEIRISPELGEATRLLVVKFSEALAEKLLAAERKYSYDDGWLGSAWMEECQAKLLEHVAKGDPRDVAAYCAFMWHHGWRTVAAPTPEQAVQEADNYVAWLRFGKLPNGELRISLCSSDSEGAFKVYRAAPQSATRPAAEAQSSDGEVRMPREPTDPIVNALLTELRNPCFTAQSLYRAILAAAPERAREGEKG